MDISGIHLTCLEIFIVVSAIIGITTAATEAILWCGVYIRKFPRSKFFTFVYPAIWFALWHIALQFLMPNRFAEESPPFSLMLYCLTYREDMLLGRMDQYGGSS